MAVKFSTWVAWLFGFPSALATWTSKFLPKGTFESIVECEHQGIIKRRQGNRQNLLPCRLGGSFGGSRCRRFCRSCLFRRGRSRRLAGSQDERGYQHD